MDSSANINIYLMLVVLFCRRYKAALKKHKYNVRAMDDTFMEINRDSAILSISSVPGLPPILPPELPRVVHSNNGSLRFSDEIKGGV